MVETSGGIVWKKAVIIFIPRKAVSLVRAGNTFAFLWISHRV